MADRNLFESDLACNRGDACLMSRKFPCMHEDDGNRLITLRFESAEICFDLRVIRDNFDRAVCTNPLVNLDDGLIKFFRFDDGFREDVGAGLIADAQSVPESAGHDQSGLLSFSFKEGIGSNRCAHAHIADRAFGNRVVRLKSQCHADAMNGRIPINAWIF